MTLFTLGKTASPLLSVIAMALSLFWFLVRWNHSHKGLINPNDFIPVAESTGQIRLLDLLIARKALAQQKMWIEQGVELGVVGINISASSLKHPD
ncbi:EAL domain-containing protein [Vibrio cyclitrophicus]